MVTCMDMIISLVLVDFCLFLFCDTALEDAICIMHSTDSVVPYIWCYISEGILLTKSNHQAEEVFLSVSPSAATSLLYCVSAYL